MNLNVTITGADDNVDPYQLVHLSRFYPFVEWGVLFSEKRRGSPRYPSFDWIRKLENLIEVDGDEIRNANLSMHLCGAEARTAVANAYEFDPGSAWSRVQVNGYEPGSASENWRRQSFRWILQARSVESLQKVVDDAVCGWCDVLYDPSGGEGKVPSIWPEIPSSEEDGCGTFEHIALGFAGGIGPGNIIEVLREVYEKNGPRDGEIWVDMESGVRTDDRFDFEKVKVVLAAAGDLRKKFRKKF